MLTNALQKVRTERSCPNNDYSTGKSGPDSSTLATTPTEKSKDWFVAGVEREANSPDRYIGPLRGQQ